MKYGSMANDDDLWESFLEEIERVLNGRSEWMSRERFLELVVNDDKAIELSDAIVIAASNGKPVELAVFLFKNHMREVLCREQFFQQYCEWIDDLCRVDWFDRYE